MIEPVIAKNAFWCILLPGDNDGDDDNDCDLEGWLVVEVVGVKLCEVRPGSIDGRTSADCKNCVATPDTYLNDTWWS